MTWFCPIVGATFSSSGAAISAVADVVGIAVVFGVEHELALGLPFFGHFVVVQNPLHLHPDLKALLKATILTHFPVGHRDGAMTAETAVVVRVDVTTHGSVEG